MFTSTTQPVTTTLADLPAPPLQWLWHARLPAAHLTLLAAHPAAGKTALALHLAAQLSTAQPLGPEIPERRTQTSELRTPNLELTTQTPEPPIPNSELRTQNSEFVNFSIAY